MTGISGAMPTELRARISAIQSRFDPNAAPATNDSSAATSDPLTMFQSLLTRAVEGTSGTGAASTALTTDALGAAATATDTTAAGASTGAVASPERLARLASDPQFGKFATDILDRLGMPKTTENTAAMVAWAKAEGTKAANNPLATTQRMGAGETSFNSVGVKNYPSYEVGLDATVRTLRNGRYDEVLAALSRGNSAEQVGRAVAASPWGTRDGVLRVLGHA